MKQPPSGELLVTVAGGKRALSGFISAMKFFSMDVILITYIHSSLANISHMALPNQRGTGKCNPAIHPEAVSVSPKHLVNCTNDNHMTHHATEEH